MCVLQAAVLLQLRDIFACTTCFFKMTTCASSDYPQLHQCSLRINGRCTSAIQLLKTLIEDKYIITSLNPEVLVSIYKNDEAIFISLRSSLKNHCCRIIILDNNLCTLIRSRHANFQNILRSLYILLYKNETPCWRACSHVMYSSPQPHHNHRTLSSLPSAKTNLITKPANYNSSKVTSAYFAFPSPSEAMYKKLWLIR